MKCAWKLVALLFVLVLFVSMPVGGRPKPPSADPPVAVADPLRSILEKKGYVAIPLVQQEEDGSFVVECRSGAETWQMHLDTGAEYSSLDMGIAKKLGLKHREEVTGVGIEGTRKGFNVSLRGLLIGDYDSRATANSLSFAAFDFTVMNAAQGQRKLRRIDGLLGHAALLLNPAVIDYSTRTLYLRPPLRGLWPEIEGKWVATSGHEDGRARRIDPAAPPRLEFKDRQLHLTDGANRYRFGLHVKPDKDRYTVLFFDPEQELAAELNYQAAGLLKVSANRLTVCLSLDPATAKGIIPDDFKAPAGSGRLLLEFRRGK